MTPAFVRHGAVTVVDIGRELSLRSGGDLKEAVADRVRSGERQFVFDFANTEFIDSAGLGVLISISRLVHSSEGTMRLMRLNEDMTRLFELTKLDTLFDVVGGPSADETVLPPGDGIRRSMLEQPGQPS